MIRLPQLFESALASKPALADAVRRNFEKFEPWLEQSGMPFFPGFTDHSPRHIEDVLSTAASLMSDDGRASIGAEDVAVLCMAILLHDCGMHLTQDGFRSLISHDASPAVSGLGDPPWDALWTDFLGEANRFSQDRLVAVFGDAEPVDVRALDTSNLSERDCLLIGEFVRRHHARLAHEIAIRGVPSRSAEKLCLTGLDAELLDLAGLVARSHGMAIRSTFKYISDRYGLIPEYRKVKTPFLMAVLRIADYVQVQSERALKSLLSVKELRSPISRQEWRNHFAVRDISTRHDDPEALYVHAQPSDVKTYLRLDGLFRDIQRELDESWATLGEVYGRIAGLNRLGLTVRRIRSNLDLHSKFASGVTYMPVRAGFNTSGPDLLKLLVGPLYDYEYAVGIRELVQNAVDACRERDDEAGPAAASTADVSVEIEENADGSGRVKVTDRGVGMTPDTVINYFLVAGASFRNSEVWKRKHVDDYGNVRVMRGGRFGVGALAAFLLGEQIHVRTRHASSTNGEGVEFWARIEDAVVELRRAQMEVGTSISVTISDADVLDKLRPNIFNVEAGADPIDLDDWYQVDWFAQQYPAVEYLWRGFNRPKDMSGRARVDAIFRPAAPFIPQEASEGWKYLHVEQYRAFLWKYMTHKQVGPDGDRPASLVSRQPVVVNGMRVRSVQRYYADDTLELEGESQGGGPIVSILRPALAIFDPRGVCPINLQRSSVSFNRMGIDKILALEVLKHLWRDVVDLRSAPHLNSLAGYRDAATRAYHSKLVRFNAQTSPIGISSSGVFLASPKSIAELRLKSIFFVAADAILNDAPLTSLLRPNEAIIWRLPREGTQATLAWLRGALAEYELPGAAAASDYSWWLDISVPLFARCMSASLVPGSVWGLATKAGKVRKSIIHSVTKLVEGASRVLVASGAHSGAETPLIKRLAEVGAWFGEGAYIDVWETTSAQPFASKESILQMAWESTYDSTVVSFADRSSCSN